MVNFPRGVVPLSVVGTLTGCAVLLRDYMVNPSLKYKGEEKVLGRTIIVTGASSGLGKAAAKELADRGGKVIMACRDLEKCEQVRKEIMEATFNKKVYCKELNLASLKSIREFAENINATEQRLDILINNAGVMGFQKRQLTEDGFEMHLGVNYLGPFLLTHLLMDKLKSSAPSRIINVSTSTYKRGCIEFEDFNCAKYYNWQGAYTQSKLAMVFFNKRLASMLEGTGVSSYIVYPGVCDTDIGRELPMSTSKVSGALAGGFLKGAMKTPEQGIQTLLMCALSPDVAEESGKYYAGLKEEKIHKVVEDKETDDRLYAISYVWTGLTPMVKKETDSKEKDSEDKRSNNSATESSE